MTSWSSVLWLVQSKLRQEDVTSALCHTFNDFGLNWGAFPLQPPACRVPRFPWEGKVIYYGSTRLVQEVNDSPELHENAALFYSRDTHSVAWYGPRFGADYLNANATRMTVEQLLALPDSTPEFFVRPEMGIKLFSGKVMDLPSFRQTVEQGALIGQIALELLTLVYVNDLIPISKEFRTWWIGGKVVAVVGYKRNGRIDPWIEDSNLLRGQVEEFALAQGHRVSETEAVVLDVAVTEKGLKVVEINCIHSAGFYLKDVIPEIVCELTNYVTGRERT